MMEIRRIVALLVILAAIPARLDSQEVPRTNGEQEEGFSGITNDPVASTLAALAKTLWGPSAHDADRAARAIRRGDYDRGMEALAKAIAENPGDAGQTYDPSSGKPLAAESLEYGREQVRRMLKDRPVMLNHVQEDDLLVRWAARKFAGEDLGSVIAWDPAPPEDKFEAQHVPPVDGRKAAIRVAKTHGAGPDVGVDLTFEELWAAVVFELHNIVNTPRFAEVRRDAAAGRLTRDAYVAAIFRLEFAAMQRTRAFYCRVYLLWAREKTLRSDPAIWYLQLWDGVDDALKQYPRTGEYPWGYYGRSFDDLVGGSQ